MKKIFEILKSELTKEILKNILPHLITISISIFTWFNFFLKGTLTKIFFISTIILFGIIITLILNLFKLVKTINKYKTKPKFDFNKKLGCYFDKDNNYYCANCYIKGIISPLRSCNDYYECMVKECNLRYYIKEVSSYFNAEEIDNNYKY